jgi:nicotinamide-nucleotide amidase
MQAEIITIGDEILIGQTIDTNSAWMGQHLNEVGVDVHAIQSVRDTKESILASISKLDSQTKLVLITGGLGPTKDDITKTTLAEYFQTELEFRQDVFDHLKRLFQSMGRDISNLNRDQAWLPKDCEALRNDVGTAWGMKFKDEKGRYFISMPGVPYEMKFLMREHILSWIKKDLLGIDILHRTLLTQGVPESVLADRIKQWEEALPSQIKLAYLPSPGLVKLRLTAKGNRSVLQPMMDSEEAKLRALLGQTIFGTDAESLQALVGELLLQKGWTLSTAESCTGGYLAHLLTSIAGSSRYFIGSIVSYDNRLKKELLGVSEESIRTFGAVSEEVVRQMAEGGREKLQTDWCIAISGIAGPDGGTEEKPVGTVWIGIAGPHGRTEARVFQFGQGRDRNIRRSALMALDQLRRQLID